MMKKFISLAAVSILALGAAWAEDEPKQEGPWKKEAVGAFNISNSNYDNWQAGGEDATTWSIKLNGNVERDVAKHNWKNSGKAGYGMTKLGDRDFIKSLDELVLESIYKYKLTKLLNPYTAAGLQTQFFEGYNYSDTDKVQISNFWDPAYLTQSAGLGLAPLKDLTTRMGFQLKETFSRDYGFADDKETLGEVETVRVEPGLESITDYSTKFNKILKYETKLSFFVNFKGVEEVDGQWTNVFTAQVAKYLNVNFSFELLYDHDQSESYQRRQDISLGLNYSFL